MLKLTLNMAKNNEVESPVINLIGNGTVIKGDVRANGDIRIDGTLIGSIQAKGKVVIGTTGNVEGEIFCQSADFSGNVKADITVTELMMMKATSKITGDLKVGKLAIEPGAKFPGTCNMQEPGTTTTRSESKPARNEEKIKQHEPAD
jgi:cytoskeletal protein CcmA (bactofilin family)